MSEHHPISDLMTETMSKSRKWWMLIPLSATRSYGGRHDGIPVSKVSFGFGAGGSEFASSKHAASGCAPLAFGGGSGAGVTFRRCASSCHRQGRQRQHPRHQRAGVRHGGSSGRDDPGCDQQGFNFVSGFQGQDKGRSRSGGSPDPATNKTAFSRKTYSREC